MAKKIKRTIYFHELSGTVSKDNELHFKDSFIKLFEHLKNLYITKSSNRFFYFDSGRRYLVTDLLFADEKSRIRGKILSIREDVFPQLMEENDDLVDIDAEKYRGVVESTHFFLSIHRNKTNLAIEYNLEGAKVSDFITILRLAGQERKLFHLIDWAPLTQNTLDELEGKAGRISEFTMKIHRTNIEHLDQDLELTKIFGHPQDYFSSQYATYDFKFDYKRQDTGEVSRFIIKAKNLFKKKPKKMAFIDTLKIRAEDLERGKILATFDLLDALLKRERMVERKEKSKVLVSSSMYTELHSEMYGLELL